MARRPPLPRSISHGILVTSCVDVVQNPGPPPQPQATPPRARRPPGSANPRLRVTSANITSLLSQFDVVTRLPGDILALQETHMGDGAQRHMDRALAELGWTIA